MRARNYLEQIRKLDKLIAAKLEEIEKLKEDKESAISISLPTSEKVQSSPRHDKLERMVARFADMELDLYEELIEKQNKRRAILLTLEELPPIEYSVLYDIYVNYLPYNIIADKMDRSYSYVSKKHSKGLKKLQEILDERNERDKSAD